MNRIILIGNGFDLAHGLKTSYQDFLDDYWAGWYEKLRACKDCQLSDEFYQFSIKRGDQLAQGVEIGHLIYLFNLYYRTPDSIRSYRSYKDLVQLCSAVNEHRIVEGSPNQIHHRCRSDTSGLFIAINKASLEKWVDIENQYYYFLRHIYSCHLDPANEITAKMLNADLSNLKDKLIGYLCKIQDDKITSDIINEDIKKIIFEPFNPRDISNSGRNTFSNFIKHRYDIAKDESVVKSFLHKHYPSIDDIAEISLRSDIREYIEPNEMNAETHEKKYIYSKRIDVVPKFFLIPEDILFLNFNYTKTVSLYRGQSTFPLNYIHGELGDDKNPVIFGYGDEMDEHYKKIADLNDNEYLQNIKSIRYLDTDNYRNLLAFIDSAPYQIYIMGHSCGNSDRTLLNTLFEHKNCVSIKPFYYQREDGADDYINIVQNISRNFKDATLMRDRVVNKTYCKPLPQLPK